MRINRLLIPLSAAVLLLSCNGTKEEPKAAIKIEVTDIGSRTATVSVNCEGPAPTLVRLTEAIQKEEFPSPESVTEEQMVDFLKTHGSAVSVPYSSALKDLFPGHEYMMGAISFNKNMDVLTWTTVEFRAEDLGTTTVGDPSGAGSLTHNELEDL